MKQAACIYIKNTQTGLVLLTTRRRKEGEPIRYGLPGGKVDPGETMIEAAIRETFEETGFRLKAEDLKPLYTEVCKGKADSFNPAVDYETACFYTEVEDIKIPGGIEDGIFALWGCRGDLLERSTFAEYNREMIKNLV